MAWKKAPDVLIEPLYAGLPDDPGVECRKMFGYPSACMSSNMFTGFYEDDVVVRLSEESRAERAGIANVSKTAPGRKMREYPRVPDNFKADPASPAGWIADSLIYATTQPKTRKMKKAN